METPPVDAVAPVEGETVQAIDPVTGTLTGFRYSGRSDADGNQVFNQVSPYGNTMINRTAFIGRREDDGQLIASYTDPGQIRWPPQHQDQQARTIARAGAP